MRAETDNAKQTDEQTRSTPAASDGREINRYTCRTKNAVNPTPSTKLAKLIDTLSSIRQDVRPERSRVGAGIVIPRNFSIHVLRKK